MKKCSRETKLLICLNVKDCEKFSKASNFSYLYAKAFEVKQLISTREEIQDQRLDFSWELHTNLSALYAMSCPNMSHQHTFQEKTLKRFNGGTAFNALVPHYFFSWFQVFQFYLTQENNLEAEKIIQDFPDYLSARNSLWGNGTGPIKGANG